MNTTLSGPGATKHALAAAVNLTKTTLNSTTPICTLSPKARALSTVLTSFVGTTVTGLSSGANVAFLVAWVSWFASLRNLVIAFYQLYSIYHLQLPEGDEHFCEFMDWFIVSHDLRYSLSYSRLIRTESHVTVLGWAAWCYTTLYAPVIQVTWLAENWHQALPGLKWARAIGVGVSALPAGIDSRARYGRALGRLCGGSGRRAKAAEMLFGILSTASTTTLSVVAALELGRAAKQAGNGMAWLAIGYVFFVVIWAHYSLHFAAPHDGAKDMSKWMSLLGGVGLGAFGGVFVAVPAFVMMLNAEDHPGVGLGEYLRCEGVAWWQKMVAILP